MQQLQFILFAACLSLVSACVVPVQMSRITLSEQFTQSFDFGQSDSPVGFHATLGLLIGEDRVEKLIDSPLGNDYIEQMQKKKIIATGVTTMTFSLVPGKKPEQFYVGGSGYYNIVDTSRSTVYYSAHFSLLDDVRYDFSMLDTSSILPIQFDQVLINHFDYDTSGGTFEHRPDHPILVEAVLNRSVMEQSGKPIFGIDYSVGHRISINGETIGHVYFRPPQSEYDKLIDIRGMKGTIRRDYHKYRATYDKH